MGIFNCKTRNIPVSSGRRSDEGSSQFSSQTGQQNNTPVDSQTGHTHGNKADLDAIRVADGYILLRTKLEGSSESAEQKVKSGKSDETVSESFETGMLGAGHRMWTDPSSGESFAEVDYLLVRRKMTIYELALQQVRHQGGIIFQTAAGMEVTEVENVVVNGENGYKCYFDTKDGSQANEFAVGDQARCQRFDMQTLTSKYYWRLVVAVGTDYIVLSQSDCDTGSGIPATGDIIVQCGNRTDTTRQAAKISRTIGEDSPRDEYYAGINSYNLTSKLVTVVGVKDGQVGVYTTKGSFRGSIDAKSGEIGAFTIGESSLSNIGDNPEASIIIWQTGGKFFRVNDGTAQGMVAVRADSSVAIHSTAYGDDSTAIYAQAQAGDNTKAIESVGNIEHKIRNGEAAIINFVNENRTEQILSSPTIKHIVVCTQSQYDALANPDPYTEYHITNNV